MTRAGPTERVWPPIAALAAVCYLPLLLTHRGMVGADTKSYLYLDPDRLLGRAWSMWDSNVGLGTVPHQNIGYLWPMGPYYWAFERLGIPDWVAQRLWLGSILFLAGLGARYVMRSLGQSGPGVTATMFLYALTPFVLTLGARISALLLPYTALGWLLGFTIRACRERNWFHPALFALAVPTFGSTNATALLLVGIAPAMWVPYATFVLRELKFREALGVVARIGVLTVGASLWWIVGLWCQGSFGLDVLSYTETARTVAASSTAPELLRGIGYWYFYGNDKFGPWIEPSVAYTQNPGLILLTYAVPTIGLLAAGFVRWRHRGYFVSLILVGLVVAVGAHPWDRGAPVGRGFQVFLESGVGLAMRSLPRAVPIIALALAVLVGVAVSALAEVRPQFERPAAWALAALAVLALPPLWLGQMVGNGLQREEQLPDYWYEAATEIDSRSRGPAGFESRVLEVPGSDFASYRWGNTVDPITPGIIDRPYVSRELIPYGTPASADLLNAFDRQMQEDLLDPDAVAPLARLMGVGDIVHRGDLAYERFNLARPRQVDELLRSAPGIGPVTGFGEPGNTPDPRFPLEDELELGADPDLPDAYPVGLFTVDGDPSIVTAKPASRTVVVAGNGDGLIAAAAAGLIDGTELIRYSGSAFATDGGGPDSIRDWLADGGAVVVTDTNRRSPRRWGTVRETNGATETADSPEVSDDPTDNRLPLFEGAGPDSQSVALWGGGVSVEASSYGNAITYTPEDRPTNVLDDDLRTVWYTGAFADARGEHVTVTYDEARTTDRIRLVQAARGVQNRWISEVRLTFDDGESVDVALGEESRTEAGQWIDFGERTFSEVEVQIRATDVGSRDSWADISAIGFADIRLGDDDVRLDESIRPPVDVLDALGPDAADSPLAVVLTRHRSRPEAALRSDEEPSMQRDLVMPAARSFGVSGTARLADAASDALIDRWLGLAPASEGGVDVDSSRHLPGDLSARATAAIDGDPSTHWMPGYLGQNAEWASYRLPEAITFDRMDLQVVADGRHTVPTRLRIVADGVTTFVDLPVIPDRPEKDSVTDVEVELDEPITGAHIEIHIDASREVTTPDWLSVAPVVMPVGITDWGIPGLRVDAPADTFDSGCRSDLVTVDGEPVSVRITGSSEDAVAGRPLDVVGCDASTEIDLPQGTARVGTAIGADIGLHIDTLVLRSAIGGGADDSDGLLSEPAEDVGAEVVEAGRWQRRIDVGARSEPTWLVIGESHNAGWKATVDGEDLGPPQLVDGFSSAFLLPPGEAVTVEVVWWPQKVVLGGLAISAVAAAVAGALVVVPWIRRRRCDDEDGDGLVDPDPPPLPLSLRDGLTEHGPAVTWSTTAAVALASALTGLATVNLAAALVMAAAAVATCRTRRARALVTVAPAALLMLSGIYIALQQIRHRLPDGFEWPARFSRVHGVAYVGVLLLALGLVVDHLRRTTLPDQQTDTDMALSGHVEDG